MGAAEACLERDKREGHKMQEWERLHELLPLLELCDKIDLDRVAKEAPERFPSALKWVEVAAAKRFSSPMEKLARWLLRKAKDDREGPAAVRALELLRDAATRSISPKRTGMLWAECADLVRRGFGEYQVTPFLEVCYLRRALAAFCEASTDTGWGGVDPECDRGAWHAFSKLRAFLKSGHSYPGFGSRELRTLAQTELLGASKAAKRLLAANERGERAT